METNNVGTSNISSKGAIIFNLQDVTVHDSNEADLHVRMILLKHRRSSLIPRRAKIKENLAVSECGTLQTKCA
ncbi:hypothetical protein KP509_18G064400 [Ceratopteris richardii]|uniref:Uncharacterized protein n=1 Tax=Ceratopteris richardii TaxID=49495 RepID=A0A8T2SRU7_CERRI|nr:hypothetical protein KP509_18G064400 [Ceratopteris richardii]